VDKVSKPGNGKGHKTGEFSQIKDDENSMSESVSGEGDDEFTPPKTT